MVWKRPTPNRGVNYSTGLNPSPGSEPKCDRGDGNEAVFKLNGDGLCAYCYDRESDD